MFKHFQYATNLGNMKGLVVFIAFCATAYGQIFIPNCSYKELGILWPCYEDREKYYHCKAIGQPILLKCSRDIFIFAYQTCAAEYLYIPPPDPADLPTEFPPMNGPPTTTTVMPCNTPTTTSAPNINSTPPSPTPEAPKDTTVITAEPEVSTNAPESATTEEPSSTSLPESSSSTSTDSTTTPTPDDTPAPSVEP